MQCENNLTHGTVLQTKTLMAKVPQSVPDILPYSEWRDVYLFEVGVVLER